jgi:hypothetical protein
MNQSQWPPQVPIQRTRRNILAMAALITTVIGANLAMPKSVRAANGNGKGNGNGNGKGNGKGNGDNQQSCFLRGTAIRTVHGDRRVEDLAVGDLVPTVFGGARAIESIQRYRSTKSDANKPWAEDLRPVRIAPSALGPDMPRTNLYLTQQHALFVDGVLVRADTLINGTTITLDAADRFDELEFFHVTLETHDVIYAEGAACETLLKEEETPCAPLLSFNVPRARMKSRFRSAISPWIDRREKLDVVRDFLEERGIALRRQMALTA